MIKNAQKIDVVVTEEVVPPTKRALLTLRARRLSAIEIAEGALLADIAVVFQLFIAYLPVGRIVLQLLVPVIFAVLVLRRGFYVGCMGMCVALFIVCLIKGPGGTPLLILEAGAGLFLGLTMRARLNHSLTIVLGVVLSGIALWILLIFVSLLSGSPYLILRSLHLTYVFLTSLVGLFFKLIRLNGLWQSHIFPLLDGFMQWGFRNWLVLFYLVSSLFCTPLVLGTYLITNFFLRLLGYQVRPFPGYRLEGLLYWLARCLFKLAGFLFKFVPRRLSSRLPTLHNLKREVRRLNIARVRQRRLEKEASSKSAHRPGQRSQEKEACKSL